MCVEIMPACRRRRCYGFFEVTIVEVGDDYLVGKRKDNNELVRRSYSCPGSFDLSWIFDWETINDPVFAAQFRHWRNMGFPLPEHLGYDYHAGETRFDGVITHPLIIDWLLEMRDIGLLDETLITSIEGPTYRVGQTEFFNYK